MWTLNACLSDSHDTNSINAYLALTSSEMVIVLPFTDTYSVLINSQPKHTSRPTYRICAIDRWSADEDTWWPYPLRIGQPRIEQTGTVTYQGQREDNTDEEEDGDHDRATEESAKCGQCPSPRPEPFTVVQPPSPHVPRIPVRYAFLRGYSVINTNSTHFGPLGLFGMKSSGSLSNTLRSLSLPTPDGSSEYPAL